jgi:hypothetical protein
VIILEPEWLEIVDRRLHRFAWDGSSLTRRGPAPRYLNADDQGFGWDAVVASGAAWFLDDGERTEGFRGHFRGQGVATAPLRLWRVDLADSSLSSVEVCGRHSSMSAGGDIDASTTSESARTAAADCLQGSVR